MPVIFFHRPLENTEYTVLTHIGVQWVKKQICLNPLFTGREFVVRHSDFGIKTIGNRCLPGKGRCGSPLPRK